MTKLRKDDSFPVDTLEEWFSEPERIANNILTIQENEKTRVPLVKEVYQNLENINIKEENIKNSKVFKN